MPWHRRFDWFQVQIFLETINQNNRMPKIKGIKKSPPMKYHICDYCRILLPCTSTDHEDEEFPCEHWVYTDARVRFRVNFRNIRIVHLSSCPLCFFRTLRDRRGVVCTWGAATLPLLKHLLKLWIVNRFPTNFIRSLPKDERYDALGDLYEILHQESLY